MNLQSLTSAGVVVSMLAGLLPMHLVRQKLVAAESGRREAYGLLATRLALALFAGLSMPLILIATIPQLSPALNIDFFWFLAVGVAWLPATAFVVIGAVMLGRGVDAFLAFGATYGGSLSRATSNMAWHRKVALAVALLLAGSLAYLIQVWGLGKAEEWAKTHPAAHFAISFPWATALMYVVWVAIEHINQTARK